MATETTGRPVDRLTQEADLALEHDSFAEALVYEVRALRLTLEIASAGRPGPADDASFEGYADVEIMGHRTRVGYVRTIRLGGRSFFEITAPEYEDDDGEVISPAAEVYAPSAIFSMTPITEEQAIAARKSRDEIAF